LREGENGGREVIEARVEADELRREEDVVGEIGDDDERVERFSEAQRAAGSKEMVEKIHEALNGDEKKIRGKMRRGSPSIEPEFIGFEVGSPTHTRLMHPTRNRPVKRQEALKLSITISFS